LEAATLVASWELNGNFIDASGHGYNGTAVGSVTFSNGKMGQAADFSGGSGAGVDNTSVDHIDSNISIASSSFNSGLSIMAWVNYTTAGCILAHDRSTGGLSLVGFSLSVNATNGLTLFMRDTGDRRLVGSSADNTLTPGVWHHVVATWNGSTTGGVTFYIDSVAKTASYTTNGTFTGLNGGSLPLRIGASSGDSANNIYGLQGSIDHVSAWQGALTSQEVQNDYNLAVPEPSTLLLICLGFIWMLQRYFRI